MCACVCVCLASIFICYPRSPTSNPDPEWTARHFITRALLGAENFLQAQTILRDNGVGAGDGCSVNMTFLK